jgi:hypothetical protein
MQGRPGSYLETSLLILILSYVTSLAGDNDIRVFAGGRDSTSGGSVITETYVRSGETNLIRQTVFLPPEPLVVYYRFFHAGEFLGSFSTSTNSSGWVSEPGSQYMLSFSWGPSNDLLGVVIGDKGGAVVDAFSCTNGVIFPIPTSMLRQARHVNMTYHLRPGTIWQSVWQPQRSSRFHVIPNPPPKNLAALKVFGEKFPALEAPLLANGLRAIPQLREFKTLFPDVAEYCYLATEPLGTNRWVLQTPMHERYILRMVTQFAGDATWTNVVSYEPPAFSILEFKDYDTAPMGRFGFYPVATFGVTNWPKLSAARGDLSAIGIALRTNDPVKEFEYQYESEHGH